MAHGSKLIIELRSDVTGEPDTASHSVYLCPVENTYPTGAIELSQKTINTEIWGLDDDLLDDDTDYYLFIDDTWNKEFGRVIAPNKIF